MIFEEAIAKYSEIHQLCLQKKVPIIFYIRSMYVIKSLNAMGPFFCDIIDGSNCIYYAL